MARGGCLRSQAGGREAGGRDQDFAEADILPVLRQGHRNFGENRVQEAMHKWPALREQFEGVELHLIGPLQTNKVREAVAFFDCIETVDRPKLAAALAAEMKRQNRAPKLLIQVNIGLEPQKAGVAPADAEKFLEKCQRELGLTMSGLMCIPPSTRTRCRISKPWLRCATGSGSPN